MKTQTNGPEESTDEHAPADGRGRETTRRAQYLAATTTLDAAEAEALAWREQGYAHSAIARKIGSTKATVDDRLDRVVASYGLAAVETKPRSERGETDLTPVTRDEVRAYHVVDRREWYDAATGSIERAPAWFRAWVAPAIDADTADRGGERR